MRQTSPDRTPLLRGLIAVALVASLVPPVWAHNNATIHPEIVDASLTLLRTEDMIAAGMPQPVTPTDPCDDCAFNDLWNNRGPLRPVLPRTAANSDENDNYIDAFDAGTSDILIGSVVEDGWDFVSHKLVALNHFYHARSASGFEGINDSSRVRCNTIFEFGVSLQDYTTESQRRSYLYLGRLLHHLGDMSSPPHVHGDAHLPTPPEKDDYEGRYVPYVLWVNDTLRPILDGAGPSRYVDEASDIWPDSVAAGTSPPDTSLAGHTYNRTSYAATLEFPLVLDPDNDPAGELAQMFPDDPNDPDNDGLYYDDGGLLGIAHYDIDTVGPYNYKLGLAGSDTWWPNFVSDDDDDTEAPDGEEAFYYIENLNTEVTMVGAVRPAFQRQNFELPWHPATNPVVQNTTCAGGVNAGNSCFRDVDCPGSACEGAAILERQRDSILTPVVEYTAGTARWWYRVANLPPFLKKVEAYQGTPVLKKYEADWDDVTETQDRVLPEISYLVADTHENIEVVISRNLLHVPQDREYINSLGDLTLYLEFNEPIKEISELKLVSAGGADVLDIKAAVAAQASNNVPTKDATHKEWTYLVEAVTLQGVPDLNGEMTLVVKAADKNEHWNNVGGELDATPQTPAKRDISGGFDNPTYDWHTESSNKDFVYDFADGDRIHRLLFDAVPPTTTIQVTP